MANTIPGLQTLSDSVSGTQQINPSRPQVPTDAFNMPQLQPVAAPVDTFIQAAQPSSNAANLGRLADALSAFQPQLAQFSRLQHATQEQSLEGQVPQLLAGKTPDEMQAIMRSNPTFQNVAAARLGQSLLGPAVANQTLNQARQDYQTSFDREHGDFETFANGYYKAALEKYGNPSIDPQGLFAKSFVPTMNDGMTGLRAAQSQFLATTQKNTQDNLLGNSFEAAFNAGMTGRGTPQEVAAAVRQTQQTAQNISHRSTEETNQVWLSQLATEAAKIGTSEDYEKRFQQISAILAADPNNAKGEPGPGSLLNNQVTAGDANKILIKARQDYEGQVALHNWDIYATGHELARTGDPKFEQWQKDTITKYPGLVHSGQMDRLGSQYLAAVDGAKNAGQAARQQQDIERQKTDAVTTYGIPALQAGTLATSLPKDLKVTKFDGVTEPLNQTEIQKRTLDVFDQSLDRKYADKQNDPQAMAQKFQEQANVYVRNGIPNEDWKKTINAGFASATTAAGSGQQNTITPSLSSAFDLYRRLEAAGQNYTSSVVDAKADKFFSMASAAKSAGLTDQEALGAAIKASRDKNALLDEPGLSMNETRTVIQNALAGKQASGIYGFRTDLAGVGNTDEVGMAVHEYAKILHYGSGIPMTAAINAAATKIASQYQIINGWAVNTAGKAVPPNFGDLSQKFIDNWWNTNGAREEAAGYSKGNLVVHQLGNTPQWTLMYKNDISAPNSPGHSFALPELGQLNQSSNLGALTKAKQQSDLSKQMGDPTAGMSPAAGALFSTGRGLGR